MNAETSSERKRMIIHDQITFNKFAVVARYKIKTLYCFVREPVLVVLGSPKFKCDHIEFIM